MIRILINQVRSCIADHKACSHGTSATSINSSKLKHFDGLGAIIFKRNPLLCPLFIMDEAVNFPFKSDVCKLFVTG